MLTPGRRILRPKTVLVGALTTFTVYYLFLRGPSSALHAVPYLHDNKDPNQQFADSNGDFPNGNAQVKNPWDVEIEDIKGFKDDGDGEDPNDIEPGYETDGTPRSEGSISRLQKEKDMRQLWRYSYKVSKK